MKSPGKNKRNRMNIQSRTIRYTELALIIFVWMVLLLTPVLFREDNDKPLINSVLNQLEIIIPLSALFLLNRFIFVPRLLLEGQSHCFLFYLSWESSSFWPLALTFMIQSLSSTRRAGPLLDKPANRGLGRRPARQPGDAGSQPMQGSRNPGRFLLSPTS